MPLVSIGALNAIAIVVLSGTLVAPSAGKVPTTVSWLHAVLAKRRSAVVRIVRMFSPYVVMVRVFVPISPTGYTEIPPGMLYRSQT